MKDDVTILKATSTQDLALAKSLLKAYYSERNYDVALGDYQKEVEDLPGVFAKPGGCLLLAKCGQRPAGLVGIKPLFAESCEMKRLFVLSKFRGHQIGSKLVTEVIRMAVQLKYRKIYLDTHPWMTQAEMLYREFGFKPIAPYNDNPTPGIKHFSKELDDFSS